MEMSCVEIKEFKVLSKLGRRGRIALPTFSSLKYLKNFSFDLEKLKPYFIKEEDSHILSFESIDVPSSDLIDSFLIMLGYSTTQGNLLDKKDDYKGFLDETRAEEIGSKLKEIVYIAQLKTFLESLGFEDTSNFLTLVKNDLNSRNRILILFTSNILWLKSEKETIGNVSFDKEQGKFNKIYYNENYLKNQFRKLYEHPRCQIGFLNSMMGKNLSEVVSGIEIKLKFFTAPSKEYLLDQNVHDDLRTEEEKKSKKSKPIFVRNMDKIVKQLTNYKEANIIILESEYENKDSQNLKKLSDSTKFNSLDFNIFDESYFTKTSEQLGALEVEIDRNTKYLLTLLDNCVEDVREYIKKNPRVID